MRTLLLLAVVALAVQDVPNRGPNEGKWAHQVGHTCWRLEEREFQHHCECKQMCDGMGNEHEDNTCATYCASRENGASSQCICHADEGTCPGPEIEAPKPKKGKR